jgi:FkbM family methyltransferase
VIADSMRRKVARGDHEFFFIQIGAHDGLHNDPIRPFIIEHHWRGVLVEPQPKIFRRLVENYSGEPQLAFENAAIAEQDGAATLYTLSEGPRSTNLTMAASFDESAVQRIGRHYKVKVESFVVPTLSVESLLARHGVRSLDLVQVDAEGYDDRIVTMFARSNVRPTIFHFESGSLSPERVRACLDLLADANYQVVTIGRDTVAYRKPMTHSAPTRETTP